MIQPGESGLDASPKFDAPFGWQSDGLPGFPLLVRRNRRLDFDNRGIQAGGGTIVCGTAINVLHGLSRLALGQPSITPAIVERLYDKWPGLFHQLIHRSGHDRPAGHQALT
jgi:hypothetical protein